LGVVISAEALKHAVVDGVTLSGADLKIN
jgi:hypothetical protein